MLAFLLLFLPGIAPATEQVTLRMLAWDGYAPVEAQKRFKQLIREMYDVELSIKIESAINPDPYFNKIRSGLVDIISPAHNLPRDSRYNLTDSILTLPIKLENIPNYDKLIPEPSRQQWAMNHGEMRAVPIVHGFYILACTSAVIHKFPTCWAVFWDPKYNKGRFSVNLDYYELNVYIALLGLGKRKEDIFHYDSIKVDILEENLPYLAQNAGAFWRGYDQPEHSKDVICATTWRFAFPDEIIALCDWRMAEPAEGTPWTIDTIMLSKSLKDNGLKKKDCRTRDQLPAETGKSAVDFRQQTRNLTGDHRSLGYVHPGHTGTI